MDAEGGGGGRMKRPVVVEDSLREPRERGSSSGRCQDRCLYTGRESSGKSIREALWRARARTSPPPYIKTIFSLIVDPGKMKAEARAVGEPPAAGIYPAAAVARPKPPKRQTTPS